MPEAICAVGCPCANLHGQHALPHFRNEHNSSIAYLHNFTSFTNMYGVRPRGLQRLNGSQRIVVTQLHLLRRLA